MLLYIDSTIRNDSRTRKIASYLVNKLGDDFKYIKLEQENLAPLNKETLQKREEDIKNKDYSNPYFKYAYDFANADIIVMASPYYDFSFSSLLKVYLENITIEDITFNYHNGKPNGLCKAKKLYYVTTSGGHYNKKYSYDYIEKVAKTLYGIEETYLIRAECFDIFYDKEKEILEKAFREIDELVK